jgi:hypothetical protein
MPIPDFAVVWDVLHAHDRAAAIHRALSEAWTDYQKYPERIWWRRRSTRASIVWEHAVDRLIGELEQAPGAAIIPHQDTVLFVLDNMVLLRLKKASIELFTANVPTQFAQAFHLHQLDLPGFNGLHRVEAVYVLDEFETHQQWIGIVARQKKQILWHFELSADGGIEQPVPLFPQSPAPESAGERIVQHKKTTGIDEKKKQTGDESGEKE